MQYINNGYTGRVKEGLTIVHGPDGHIVCCRKKTSTEEELKNLVDRYSEVR